MNGPLHSLELHTPAGRLGVLLTADDGVVRASGFCPVADLVARLAPELTARGTTPGDGAGQVATAVAAYADGEVEALCQVEVEQPGGPFLQDAWRAMRAVPAGTTTSYAALAAAAGRPTAVRATGSACARNLVAPFVPCHRVLRSDGSLGGFLYGLEVKRSLLAHERR